MGKGIQRYGCTLPRLLSHFDDEIISDLEKMKIIYFMKSAYQEWCNEEQLPNLPVSDFKKALLDKKVKEKKIDSQRFYEGIKLNDTFIHLHNEYDL